MEAVVTKKGSWERVVEVDVPEKELSPHFDQAYQKYRKNLKLEGFRKGKAPLSLIKKLYGDAIKSEAIDEVVNSVFQEVRKKEGLRPVAPAKLEDINYDPASGLRFRAVVEVVPEFELKKYTGISAERETYQVDDEDVAQALEEYQERMATMETIDGEATEDNYVLVDLQQVDETGMPIIGRKYEDRLLHLGTSEETRELTNQLVGVKADETRRVQITAYDEKGNKGGLDYFDIKVKEVKLKQVPALDDELAKDVGEFETLEQLKDDTRERLNARVVDNARRGLHHQIIDEVLKQNPFDLPESMINNYLDAVVESAKSDSRQPVDEAALREQYRASAIWTIRWEMARDTLQKLENITVSDDEINNKITEVAKARGAAENEIKKTLRNARARDRVRDDLLEEKTLEFLESHAKIKDKKVTRKDLEKARRVALK